MRSGGTAGPAQEVQTTPSHTRTGAGGNRVRGPTPEAQLFDGIRERTAVVFVTAQMFGYHYSVGGRLVIGGKPVLRRVG